MYILLGQKHAAADGQVVGHFGLLPAFNYMAVLNYQQLTYLVKRIHWQQAHPGHPKFFNNFLCNSCFTTSTTTTYTWQWTNKVSGGFLGGAQSKFAHCHRTKEKYYGMLKCTQDFFNKYTLPVAQPSKFLTAKANCRW